jgi:filamentous hemagglutinin family protein
MQTSRSQTSRAPGLGPVLGALSGVLLATCPTLTLAQIAGDGTLGTQVNGFAIAPCIGLCTIDGGTIRGPNLFHSFKDFSIPTGGQAWFDNALQIQTIFTRVTGSSLSTIDGLIKTNGTASLFLLNPNGILFGPHAALDIGGSFLATTANAFTFGDGREFSATNPQAPPLLTLNVTPGLQWGSGSRATITNRGNLTTGQDLTLAATYLDLQGQLSAGKNLALLAQDTVQLRDSTMQPFIAAANGNLLIQGDRSIDISILKHPQSTLFSGSGMVLRSASPVLGDAHFLASRAFRVEQLDGSLGSLWSPHDPVIRSSGDVAFDNYTGVSLHILAGGNVNITGIVNITGADTLANSLQETVTLSDGTRVAIDGNARPTLDIRAGTTAFGIPSITGATNGFTPIPGTGGTASGANIVIGSIRDPNGSDISDRLVYLTNQYAPNPTLTGSIRVKAQIDVDGFPGNAGAVVIDSRGGVVIGDEPGPVLDPVILARGPGGGNGQGGTVTILAMDDIRAPVMLLFGLGGEAGGSARLLSRNGGIATPLIVSGGEIPGDVTLTAKGNISIGYLLSSSSTTAKGGTINLTSESGAVTIAGIDTTSQFGDGGTISVTSAQDITTTLGTLDSGSFSTGKGGDIRLTSTSGNITTQNTIRTDSVAGGAGQIQLTAAGNITTSSLNAATFGNDNGGSITIDSGATFTATNSMILTGTAGSGKAGNIDIQAATIALTDSEVNSGTTGAGLAGDIILQGDSVSLINGAAIITGSTGPGSGGNVTVNAKDSFTLRGTSATGGFSEVTTGTLGEGNAGNVAIAAGQLVLRDGAVIASTTGNFLTPGSPAGRGGSLLVNADVMDISGISPDGKSPSRLATASFSPSDAGDLTVNARQVSLQAGGILSTSTFSSGRGGALTVNAVDSVRLDGSILSPTGRTPTAFSADTFGIGRAGNLTVNTRQLTVQNGAAISTSTFATGQGGRLTVNASENVLLQGADPDGFASGLYAQATDQGDAGTLLVRSPAIQVRDRATITVASGSAANLNLATNTLKSITGIAIGTRPATGVAGTLSLQADRLVLDQAGQLLASTDFGQGGNIDLTLRDALLMRRSSLISATAGTAQAGGDGGNITINAPFVMAPPGENNDIIANAFTGRGGNVTINANSILNFTLNDKGKTFNQLRRQATNDISASSEFGSDGTLNLTGLNTNPAQGTVQLPSATSPPQPIQGCQTASASPQTAKVEFFTTGRGGLPSSPSDPLSSSEILDDLRIPSVLVANQRPSLPERLPSETQVAALNAPVSPEQQRALGAATGSAQIRSLAEATHWQRDPQGRVVLSTTPVSLRTISRCHLTVQP